MGVSAAEERRRYQRAWYVYDWANSAFATTVLTVFLGPYLNDVAERAAGPDDRVGLLVFDVRAGAVYSYTLGGSVIVAALLMPLVGAIADRTARDRELLAGFSFAGAAATTGFYFVSGDRYELGVALLFAANVNFSLAGVVYTAYLPRIATPEERDTVSARGSAAGFLGGWILLVLNLGLFLGHDTFGLTEPEAARISLVSAGLWWAGFTVMPARVLGGAAVARAAATAQGTAERTTTLRQLRATVAGLRSRPRLLGYVLAFLMFNEGIQTVTSHASLYGEEELGLSDTTLIGAIVVVQIVAFGGALAFGRAAGRHGAKRVVQAGLVVWTFTVGLAYVMPAGSPVAFYVLAVLIALVLGGVPALARSMFAQMIPSGREAEYFSLLSIVNKGTSALGPVVFGLTYDLTGNYRTSILVIEVFFLAGIVLLARVDVAATIAEADNPADDPAVRAAPPPARPPPAGDR